MRIRHLILFVLIIFSTLEVDAQEMEGEIFTENLEKLVDRRVHLVEPYDETNTAVDVMITDNDGLYSGTTGLFFVTLCPQSGNDWLNGVSTYDLVLISQHILGVNYFYSPYQYIAADVTYDAQVSTIDRLTIRALILYVIEEYPNCPSWRFMPEGYSLVFNDTPSGQVVNPFTKELMHPYTSPPTLYTYNGEHTWLDKLEVFPAKSVCSGNPKRWDFVAMKMGDVSGDADGSCDPAYNTSSDCNVDPDNETGIINSDIYRGKSHVKKNKTYTLHIKASTAQAIVGFQLGLAFGASEVEVKEIIPNENFPTYDSKESFNVLVRNGQKELRTCWVDHENLTAVPMNNTTLFSLEIESKETLEVTQLVRIAQDILKIEFITADLEINTTPLLAIEVVK